MSGNEGNGPDPTEYTGPANPAAEGDYLSAAANWLALAEEDLRNATIGDAYPYAESARLAELNIALATACGTYHDRQPRRFALDPAAMIREQLAADVEREQAQTLRPDTDGAPPGGQGDLWVVDREGPWFVYNVQGMPGAGEGDYTRWLLVRHHSQVLRWRDEQGTKSMPMTWRELPDQGITTLMRPTDKERETFYGAPANPVPAPWITQPVPDGEGGQIDASATEAPCACCASGLFSASAVHSEICGDCGHAGPAHYVPEQDYPAPGPESGRNFAIPENGGIPVRHVQAETPEVADLWEFTNREGTAIAELEPDELRVFHDSIAKLIPVVEGRQAAPPTAGSTPVDETRAVVDSVRTMLGYLSNPQLREIMNMTSHRLGERGE